MRKSCQFAVVLVAALGLVGAAQGAVLTGASILIPLGTVPLPPITGAGSGSSVGLGATATIGSNLLVGTVVTTGVTSVPPISKLTLSLTGHAPGSFTAGGGPGGGLGGAMTLGGGAWPVAFSGTPILAVPLSPVGQPGGFVLRTGPAGTIIQVSGTGWTTGVQTLMAPVTTLGGGTATPQTVAASGSDLRTASGAGTLILITPLFIRTNVVGDHVSFATLTLNYVPEPGTLLLVGVGIAGLALRRRLRA